MDYNIHPIQLRFNRFTLRKEKPFTPCIVFTPQLTFFSLLSSLDPWSKFFQTRTLTSYKPCSFCCVFPKKFHFWKISALCPCSFGQWSVDRCNHCQLSSYLTFLLISSLGFQSNTVVFHPHITDHSKGPGLIVVGL